MMGMVVALPAARPVALDVDVDVAIMCQVFAFRRVAGFRAPSERSLLAS